MPGLIPWGIWAASGAGGSAAGSYELITTTIVPSSQAAVTFNSSAAWSNYKHLQLRAVYGSNTGANGTYIRATFNGDAGSNYSFHYLYGQGSSAQSNGYSAQTAMAISPWSGTGSATQPDAVITDILDFASTSKNKTIRTLSGFATGSINLVSGAWFSTNAITSITLNAFSQGSASTFGTGVRFSLYGIRG